VHSVTPRPASGERAGGGRLTEERGLRVELDSAEPCPLGFAADPAVLLFFISWAYSVRLSGTR
jgi:hypothetical protein